MKKTNVTKLLLSLCMVFTIIFTNTSRSTIPQDNSNQMQLFAEDSPYWGYEEE